MSNKQGSPYIFAWQTDESAFMILVDTLSSHNRGEMHMFSVRHLRVNILIESLLSQIHSVTLTWKSIFGEMHCISMGICSGNQSKLLELRTQLWLRLVNEQHRFRLCVLVLLLQLLPTLVRSLSPLLLSDNLVIKCWQLENNCFKCATCKSRSAILPQRENLFPQRTLINSFSKYSQMKNPLTQKR